MYKETEYYGYSILYMTFMGVYHLSITPSRSIGSSSIPFQLMSLTVEEDVEIEFDRDNFRSHFRNLSTPTHLHIALNRSSNTSNSEDLSHELHVVQIIKRMKIKIKSDWGCYKYIFHNIFIKSFPDCLNFKWICSYQL